jgi:hypothetical protein
MRLRSSVLAVLVVVLLLSSVSPVFGWANGPASGDGFGTHDWLLYEAAQMAAGRGAAWVDLSVALPMTDDPDTLLHDTYYHCYDIWATPYGDAPRRISERYADVVNCLKVGNDVGASEHFALVSHYYSDICLALHTEQTVAEGSMHSSYEDAVDNITTAPGVNHAWISDDGYIHVGDAAAEAASAASSAHLSYTTLVTDYVASGYCASVQGITVASLNRGANGLADLMQSAQEDAGYTPRAPLPPVPSVITIRSSTTRARGAFTLTGVLKPGLVGDSCVVEVRKPRSARWSYSSARLAYATTSSGGATWWYRYTPRLRGTYVFRARFIADASRAGSVSRTIAVLATRAVPFPRTVAKVPSGAVTPLQPKAAYVGSSQSNKYHFPSCYWGGQIRSYNLVTFSSKADAAARGYVACGVCKP